MCFYTGWNPCPEFSLLCKVIFLVKKDKQQLKESDFYIHPKKEPNSYFTLIFINKSVQREPRWSLKAPPDSGYTVDVEHQWPRDTQQPLSKQWHGFDLRLLFQVLLVWETDLNASFNLILWLNTRNTGCIYWAPEMQGSTFALFHRGHKESKLLEIEFPFLTSLEDIKKPFHSQVLRTVMMIVMFIANITGFKVLWADGLHCGSHFPWCPLESLASFALHSRIQIAQEGCYSSPMSRLWEWQFSFS